MRQHGLAGLRCAARQRRLVDVERDEQASALGARRAHLQAHVVPRLGQRKGARRSISARSVSHIMRRIVAPGPMGGRAQRWRRARAGARGDRRARRTLWRRRRAGSTFCPDAEAAQTAARHERRPRRKRARPRTSGAALVDVAGAAPGHLPGPARRHHHEHRATLHRLDHQHVASRSRGCSTATTWGWRCSSSRWGASPTGCGQKPVFMGGLLVFAGASVRLRARHHRARR